MALLAPTNHPRIKWEKTQLRDRLYGDFQPGLKFQLAKPI